MKQFLTGGTIIGSSNEKDNEVLFEVGDEVILKGNGRVMKVVDFNSTARDSPNRDMPIVCEHQENGNTFRRNWPIDVLENITRKKPTPDEATEAIESLAGKKNVPHKVR